MRTLICLLLISLLTACGGGGGTSSSPSDQGPSDPAVVLESIQIYPSYSALNQGSGSLNVGVTIFFSKATVQVTTMRVTYDSIVKDYPIPNITPGSSGATQGSFQMDTTKLGSYTIKVQLVYDQNQVSATASAPFRVGPAINVTSPMSVASGGSAFTLDVQGVGFTPNSVAQWNNNPRPTSYVSETLLQASISAQDIGAPGTANVEVVNPYTNGGLSNSFAIPISNLTTRIANIPVNDLVWDPIRKVIYASTPSTAGATGNSIVIIDPATGNILNSVFAGSEPNTLVISDDGQFLYTSLDGASTIKRFTLPGLVTDISIPLGTDPTFGPYYGRDIQVAPSLPHTIAVALGVKGITTPAKGGIVVFDDTVPRPNRAASPANSYSSIQWGADSTKMYSVNNESTGFNYYVLTVEALGVSLFTDIRSVITEFGSAIQFDRSSSLIYADSGQVIVPTTGSLNGTFPASGRLAIDFGANLLYFANNNPSKALSKYPPAEPGALLSEPLEAAGRGR